MATFTIRLTRVVHDLCDAYIEIEAPDAASANAAAVASLHRDDLDWRFSHCLESDAPTVDSVSETGSAR